MTQRRRQQILLAGDDERGGRDAAEPIAGVERQTGPRLAIVGRRLDRVRIAPQQVDGGGDAERAAQAETERGFLVRELTRAFGLSGRGRRAASAPERARASVTPAVRQAMARIGEHHPGLGEHLGRTIRTGTYCAYLPDPRAPAAWVL